MTDILSILGAILILAGYFGVQTRRMDAAHLPFSIVNLAGAALLAYVAIIEEQVGFVLLEGAWVLISIAGIARVFTRSAA
jgi:hypothetical protein